MDSFLSPSQRETTSLTIRAGLKAVQLLLIVILQNSLQANLYQIGRNVKDVDRMG